MHRYRLAALAAFLGLLTLSAHAAAPLHHTFNVAAGGTLTVDADIGSIRVVPGARNVDVTVERSGSESALKDFEVTFDQSGNDVHIRARFDGTRHWFMWGNELDVRFIINVPAQYSADVRTSGGNIDIGDLHGRVMAHTSGGNIAMGRIDGPVDANTSGGGVRLEGSSRNALLKTSGGTIHAGDIAGHLEARTSGGSIDVRHAGDLFARSSGGGITVGEVGGPIDAQTSGGSIRIALARQPASDSRLSTSGGSIVVSLASNIGVTIDAHTSGGDVETDVPVEMLGKQGDGKLNGKIHGGGPRLELRTSGGDIRVRRL